MTCYLSASWRENSLKGAVLFVFDVCRSLSVSNIVILSYLSIIRGRGEEEETQLFCWLHTHLDSFGQELWKALLRFDHVDCYEKG